MKKVILLSGTIATCAMPLVAMSCNAKKEEDKKPEEQKGTEAAKPAETAATTTAK
ncbi:hypothetical protein [Mycoplasma tauri]|uniref:hypothetical protein n=1 Tax=Mycoplasma tauri TaxID=547987 RepID=UPI001CBBFF9A|nr:hypothetical protein [Mycoplasma tauri]MBZ4226626.1 hypothetical protein [Mycoplasma tauri]